MSIANSLELEMLSLINGERSAVGLAPLRLITLLNEAAQVHSSWMLETDTFTHEGFEDSSASDRMEAAGYPFEGSVVALENIGWQSLRGEDGPEDDVAQVHESLMASPEHRANILDPDAEDIGIGIEVGTFTEDSTDYEAVMVTQVFAATEADISAWIDPGFTAEDTDIEETGADGEAVDDEAFPDIVAEDDAGDMAESGEDVPDPGLPAMPQVLLPCGLENFTVDLTAAFEFRKDGDQLIWETSEDKLVEAFLAAFEDWASVPEANEGDTIDLLTEDDDPSLVDLLSEGMSGLPADPLPADNLEETDGWDLATCA